MKDNTLRSISFILFGTLLALEGWKVHPILSLIGLCISFFGVHVSRIEPVKLAGRALVVYISIIVLILGVSMLFPNIFEKVSMDTTIEFVLGFLVIMMTILVYDRISRLWHGL